MLSAAGMIFVAIEMRFVARSINGNTSAQVYTYMVELLKVQIEHPELRCYVYDGEPVPTEGPEAARVAAFLGAFGDFIEFMMAQRTMGTLTAAEYEGTWLPFLKHLLKQSPGLRSYVTGSDDFYAADLVEMATQIDRCDSGAEPH